MRLAVIADYSIFIYRQAGERCAEQMEFCTLAESVLCGLGNSQITTLESVIKCYCCSLTADNGNPANLLRLVFVVHKFC